MTSILGYGKIRIDEQYMKKEAKRVNLSEARYKKSIRAIKRLESIKLDVGLIHSLIWRIKNKLKNR